ncbi:MAG TPA: UTP--glucose-1-phosphate uridylyltransferase GalU [Nitrospiria bacterium]|nr:UTP--glucose-1-phosphate uridylyltransferase GalU [Nitrospiria bacterium]
MRASPIVKAVIPAAGLGTRFLPATKASPKEMLPLVDKPLIQYVVEEAVAAGIREIVIVTGRGKRAIEDHFDVAFELETTLRGQGKKKQLDEIQEITDLASFYYVRQREAKGLGHAVLQAKGVVGSDTFAVLLGDDIIDHPVPAIQQLITMYREVGASVIGLQPVTREEVSQYGIIQGREVKPGLYQITDLIEKPSPEQAPSTVAVIGRYVLTGDIFEILERTEPGRNGEVQLTDALRVLARQGRLYGKVLDGRRHDAGDKLGFLKATVEFGLKNPELGPAFRRYLEALRLK